MLNAEKDNADLGARTKAYALRIIRLYTSLEKTGASGVLGKQLLRSGTSVGAQYREAKRARSNAEFVSKLESASQELEESGYWLELLIEGQLVHQNRLQPLLDETNELMAMFIASIRTAKRARLS